MAKVKAKIFNSTDKCMTGLELRRLRQLAGLTQGQLADKLNAWGWYKNKVIRFEQKEHFCVHPFEMQSLLNALGAVSI